MGHKDRGRGQGTSGEPIDEASVGGRDNPHHDCAQAVSAGGLYGSQGQSRDESVILAAVL